MKKKISILILTWNKKDLLKKCMESVLKNTHLTNNIEIIIIENGGNDGTEDFVKKSYPFVKFIKLNKNKGFSGGINEGLKIAKGDFIFFVSNDVLVLNKNWIDQSLKIFEKEKKLGLLGYQTIDPIIKNVRLGGKLILNFNPYRIYKYIYREELKNKPYIETDFIVAAVFAIRKKILKKVGYFDENFYPFYYEDSDFFCRVKKKKFKIFATDLVEFFHNGGETTEERYDRIDLFYYGLKNRMRFKLKNYPFTWLLFWLITEWRTIFGLFLYKDKNNIKINKKFFLFLFFYFKALFYNFINLPNIISYRIKNF